MTSKPPAVLKYMEIPTVIGIVISRVGKVRIWLAKSLITYMNDACDPWCWEWHATTVLTIDAHKTPCWNSQLWGPLLSTRPGCCMSDALLRFVSPGLPELSIVDIRYSQLSEHFSIALQNTRVNGLIEILHGENTEDMRRHAQICDTGVRAKAAHTS